MNLVDTYIKQRRFRLIGITATKDISGTCTITIDSNYGTESYIYGLRLCEYDIDTVFNQFVFKYPQQIRLDDLVQSKIYTANKLRKIGELL